MAAHAPFGHGNPTALQREAWEAVARLGTQGAACALLGVTQSILQERMRGYQRAMGLTGPLPGVKVYGPRVKRGTGQLATLKATIAALEADLAKQMDVNAALLERVAELEIEAAPWAAIHAKLDAIMARPSGIFQPDHRRVADGGRTIKEQKRQARRAVA